MNSIKPVAVIGLLAALGLAVYFKLSDRPEPEPPEEFGAVTWGTPPSVEIPGSYDPAGTAAAGTAPGSSATGSAGPPRFQPAPVPPGGASTAAGGAVPPWGHAPEHTPPASPASADAAAAPAPLPFEIGSSAPPAGPSAAPSTSPTAPPLGAPPLGAPPLGAGAQNASPPPSPRYAATESYRPSAAPAAPADAGGGHPGGGSAAASYSVARRAAQAALDRGELAEALRLLTRWYDDPSLSPSDRSELIELLGQLAGTVLYSTQSFLEPPYRVEAGETLQSIAHKYHVPWQLLAKINGIGEDESLEPGRTIKVVRGPFSAIVDLRERVLTLMAGDYYAGRFRVGIGSERPQMEGQWIVKHKVTNPTYYGRDRVMDADDPNNPLGERWIGLASADQPSVVKPFGIHGTHNAQSIDRDDPRGYIRLAPQDAEDVYDILSIGSRVMVRR